jgi:hypothetical protein
MHAYILLLSRVLPITHAPLRCPSAPPPLHPSPLTAAADSFGAALPLHRICHLNPRLWMHVFFNHTFFQIFDRCAELAVLFTVEEFVFLDVKDEYSTPAGRSALKL